MRKKSLISSKKEKDTFLAGLLVSISGHIEGTEISEPESACYREIEEETGLEKNCIENLILRYIVLRMKDNQEIRIQYVFIGGVVKNSTLIESGEGALSWIDYEGIPNYNVSVTTKEIVKHSDEVGKYNEKVYVGSMKSLKGNPEITWGILEDWELPIFD